MKPVKPDLAYDFIRKRILSGEYPPGYSLITSVLSKTIGVSRTPVRDALRQLETDGLVIIRDRLGASVKTTSAKEFREMCETRLALESFAAGLAAINRTEPELREMRHRIETMKRLTPLLAAKEDPELGDQVVREDIGFHIAIMTAARNDFIKSEVLRLNLISRIVSGPMTSRFSRRPMINLIQTDRSTWIKHLNQVLLEHEKIYEAIRKGDSQESKVQMAKHIKDIIDLNIQAMGNDNSEENGRKLSEDELHYIV